MKRLAVCFLAALLAGCSNHFNDLQTFVSDADRTMRGNVEPMPPIKAYVPFIYQAANLPDPFAPRLLPAAARKARPDSHRPSQPLEKFALADLQMVGTLVRSGKAYALVKAPDQEIYYVTNGDYMGLDAGRIITVGNKEVELQETVLDSNGAWAHRRAQIHMKEIKE